MALSGPGRAIIHLRGLVHATVAQCSFWHDLRSCRKDRLAVCLLEQKPGDWPQPTVLETVAPFPHKPLWASGFKSRMGAPWAKPACGALVALFICWSWLAHSLLAPGSPSLPTGTEISVACAYTYRCHAEGKDPRVRQTYWHLIPPAGTGPS